LNPEEIDQIAKESGYIVRDRKVSGYDLLESTLFTRFNPDKLALNDHCIYFLVHKGISVSNQAIDKKFNAQSVLFLKAVLEKLLAKKIKLKDSYPLLSSFHHVRIKDSISFQTPPEFIEKYPGSGGSGSKSAIRIQFEYDLLTHKILELAVTKFNDQDQKNAKETLDNIAENDLVIRDLGYVTYLSLEGIEQRQAFYINRLNYCNVYTRNSKGEYELIDFKRQEAIMRKNNMPMKVLAVYLGNEKRVKSNLIIELLPLKTKEERIRKRLI
jgi:hypothetical protein